MKYKIAVPPFESKGTLEWVFQFQNLWNALDYNKMDKMPNETDLRTQIDPLMVEFLTIIPATEIFFFRYNRY